MEPEEDDNFQRESAPPSVFSARWFRALLILIVLVLAVVIALPYLLDQFAPTPTRSASAPKAPAPEPQRPSIQTSGPPPPPSASETVPPLSPPRTPAAPPAPPSISTQAPRTELSEPAAQKPVAKATDATTKRDGSRGGYLVQVGAFRDSANAAKLAAKLAEENYPVRRAAVTRSAPEGHEVVVIGASAAEVNDKLEGRGWRGETSGAVTVIRPPLTLKDAIALSQTLRADGLKVKIRRAEGTTIVHVVQVGGFPDRAGAETARRELGEKGYSGFVVRGSAR